MKLQELREKYPTYNTVPDEILRAKVNVKYPGMLTDNPSDLPQTPAQQLQDVQLKQAQLNYKQDVNANKVVDPSGYFQPQQKTVQRPPLESFIKKPIVTQPNIQQQNIQPIKTEPKTSLLDNAKNDLHDIVNGMLNLPKTVSDGIKDRLRKGQSIDPMTLSLVGGGEIIKGLVNEYNQALGEPMKGGNVLSRIGKRAYEKPVTTALDVLPFIGPLKKIGTAAKTTETTAKVVKPNILQKAGKALKQEAAPIYEPASVYGSAKEAAIRTTLDDLKVTGSPAEQYAKLQPAMSEVGTAITKKLADNPQAIAYKDIITKFNDNLQSLKRTKVLTNTQAISETKGYLNDLAGLKEGDVITTQKLFDLKKVVNEDYGGISTKLERGMPLTSREQVIVVARKTLDDIITSKHPDVKELTMKQSRLYDAADSLNKDRKTVPTIRVMGTTVPAALSTKLMDKTGRIIEGAGDRVAAGSATLKSFPQTMVNKIPNTGVLPPIVTSQRLEQGTQDFTNEPEQKTSDQQTYSDLNNQQDHTLPSITQPPINYATGRSPEEWMKASADALLKGDTKNAAEFDKMAKSEIAYQTKQKSSTMGGQVGKQRENLGKSGLKSIEEVERQLGVNYDTGEVQNADVLTKQLVPGQFLSRQFDSAMYNAVDALLRLRTGAQANPSEIKGYMTRIGPTFGDDPKVIIFKLGQLKNALELELMSPGLNYKEPSALPTIE